MKKSLVALLLLALFSCKKDPPYPSGKCVETTAGGVMPSFMPLWPQYRFPCFNPNNTNEFVYYFEDMDPNIYQLRKFNILTGENTVLVNSETPMEEPKWGRGGRIAFACSGRIYTVKEKGDDLQAFTGSNYNRFPSWNDVGDELTWSRAWASDPNEYLFRQKLNQPFPDTIYEGSVWVNTRMGNKLLCRTAEGYGYYDLNASTPFTASNFKTIVTLTGATTGLCWADNGQTFYVTLYADQMYKVDASTGHVTQPFSACLSTWYESVTCSSDNRFLLGERVDRRDGVNPYHPNTTEIIETRKIYLIDRQTMKETKMNLE